MNRSSAKQPLVADPDLFEFFRERVESAVVHQRAPVSEPTVFYLSQMLVESGRADGDGEETTLVELRQRAVAAPPAEAVSVWKRLGDRSLLVTGFFRHHAERRRISRDYYAGMGAAAYDALAGLFGGRSRNAEGFAAIFSELAERWHACSDVIAEVHDEAEERTDSDIVRLYEEWLATGSPRVADRLRALGVVPMRAQGQG